MPECEAKSVIETVESWTGGMAILCAFIAATVILVKQNGPASEYKQVADMYLDKARALIPGTIVFSAQGKEEFQQFSLESFLHKAAKNGELDKYIQQLNDAAIGIQKLQERFKQQIPENIPERVIRSIESQTNDEFDHILQDNNVFCVVCMYTDENGFHLQKRGSCPKEHMEYIRNMSSTTNSHSIPKSIEYAIPHTESVLADLEKVTHLHIDSAQ